MFRVSVETREQHRVIDSEKLISTIIYIILYLNFYIPKRK